nr:immunoglobulin heavy chain junction region [Mus musculus]
YCARCDYDWYFDV